MAPSKTLVYGETYPGGRALINLKKVTYFRKFCVEAGHKDCWSMVLNSGHSFVVHEDYKDHTAVTAFIESRR